MISLDDPVVDVDGVQLRGELVDQFDSMGEKEDIFAVREDALDQMDCQDRLARPGWRHDHDAALPGADTSPDFINR